MALSSILDLSRDNLGSPHSLIIEAGLKALWAERFE